MNKVQITVYVPCIEKSYELMIPINRKIGTIKKMIIEAVNELTDNELSKTSALKLCEKESGIILDSNLYVKQTIVRNGTELILF